MATSKTYGSKNNFSTILLRVDAPNSQIHSTISDRLQDLVKKSAEQTFGVADVDYSGSKYYSHSKTLNRKFGSEFWFDMHGQKDESMHADSPQKLLNNIRSNLKEFGFVYDESHNTLLDIRSGWRIKLHVNTLVLGN